MFGKENALSTLHFHEVRDSLNGGVLGKSCFGHLLSAARIRSVVVLNCFSLLWLVNRFRSRPNHIYNLRCLP